MLWLFLLQIFSRMKDLHGAEQETLCTSKACFTSHLDKVTFTEAQQNCQANGGYLMTVRDRQEETVLLSLLSRIQEHRQDRALKFWIGLKLNRGSCVLAAKTLKGFKWVSGEENSHYANWDKEPASTCTERCVRVNYSLLHQNQLKWTAGGCRTKAFYTCQFPFKGMCKRLVLTGPGQMTYTAPFSEQPQSSDMKVYPLGTYAEIVCSNQKYHYSVCMDLDQKYRWTVSGPFCGSGERSCAVNNGGCEGLCQQEGQEVQCLCGEGHDLDEDGLSCRVMDVCNVAASGSSCRCPHGFRLDEDQQNCSDMDECGSQICSEDQRCVNTSGGFRCECTDGYQLVDARCVDVDECAQSRCEHTCLNHVGSFSCSCHQGFALVQDGVSCEDVDECVGGRCSATCTNTAGSFSCSCPQNFHLDADGWSCIPHVRETSSAPSVGPPEGGSTPDEGSPPEGKSPPDGGSPPEGGNPPEGGSPPDGGKRSEGGSPLDGETPPEGGTHQNFTESLSRTLVEVQQQTPHTHSTPPILMNITLGDQQTNLSVSQSFVKTVNSRILVCVIGSVVPLLVLVLVTLAITVFRCNRSKKEEKKKTTSDGYCWVSSGLDPRLEKLYESISTDDL